MLSSADAEGVPPAAVPKAPFATDAARLLSTRTATSAAAERGPYMKGPFRADDAPTPSSSIKVANLIANLVHCPISAGIL